MTPRDPRPRGTPPLHNRAEHALNLYEALDAAKKDRARWKQEASGGLSIPTDLTQDPTLSIHDPQGQLSNAQEPTEIV